MARQNVAVVTGAGSGVGRATSILLAQAGFSVVLVARTRARLAETADLTARDAADGVELLVHPADLSDPREADGVVDITLERFGRLDALVNVAGYASAVNIAEITLDEWRRTIDTNLTCVLMMAARAWPAFEKQRGGTIVNVSSLASIDPFPAFALYGPAKAAVNNFTLCVARQGESIGVKAVAVAPGAIETPMLRSLFDEKTLPTEKTLDPRDVAALIRDCITGAREFESGETIQMPSP